MVDLAEAGRLADEELFDILNNVAYFGENL